MITTHECIDLPKSLAWEPAVPPANLSWHRLGGISAEDFAVLALGFLPAEPARWGGDPPAAMGQYLLRAGGAVSWDPPYQLCGYHYPTGTSVEIDAESGGGYETRPALPKSLASGDVLPRLIRRVRALLPSDTGVDRVDVHAVRLRGGVPRTWPVSRPARAMVALLVAPSASSASRPAPATWGMPRIRQLCDALCWSGRGPAPTPADVVDGDAGDVLLFAFRG